MKIVLLNLQKHSEPKRNTAANFLGGVAAAKNLKNGMKQAQTDEQHPLNNKNRKTRVRKG